MSIGVWVLRRTRPELPRSFRVPMVQVLPWLSAAACLWLMLNLPGDTWLRFISWMVIGIVIYAAYGRRRSRLASGGDLDPATAGEREAARGRDAG